jgi:hypothetical protein
MTRFTRDHRISTTTLAALVLLAGTAGAWAQGPAQAQEKFKNLQVLPKDIARPELIETMRSFSLGLNVRCAYCHVGEEQPGPAPMANFKWDLDDKPTKVTARQMLRMVTDINGKYLADLKTGREQRVAVKCVTCHHGTAVPSTITEVLQATLDEKGTEAAVTRYRELRERTYGSAAYDFSEEPLHEFARTQGRKGKPDDGLAFEKLCGEYFPKSGRVPAGMAELYLIKGDKETAIAQYKKAIEMDPGQEFYKNRLAAIEKGGK